MRAFIDFEASSLARDSYPIEVGWVFEDGRGESHLIRPLPAWTDWDPRAAAIHGISRSTLETVGLDVDVVAHRLLDSLLGHAVHASSPSWDGKWLSVLLRGAGLPRHALRLASTGEAQREAAIAALAGVVEGAARDALADAIVSRTQALATTAPVIHRALPDAVRERRLWLAVAREARREAARLAGPGNTGQSRQ